MSHSERWLHAPEEAASQRMRLPRLGLMLCLAGCASERDPVAPDDSDDNHSSVTTPVDANAVAEATQTEDDGSNFLSTDIATGFYGQLSPQVSGGHFVSHPGQGSVAVHQVCYISVQPLLAAEDIESIDVVEGNDETCQVSVTLSSAARKHLIEVARIGGTERQRMLASTYALVFVRDGAIQWVRDIGDVVEENATKVAACSTREEANALVAQLRAMDS